MLARGSLGRWAAATTSARDLPQLARFLSQTLCARQASDLPVARAVSRAYISALNGCRGYATATATATKPTATVKKAVKAQAQTTARPKRAAASKKTTKTAKKPAKKATAKKAKPKPKAKKPAPKKPAPRKKKVLTPEEKTKVQIRELRKTALKEPHGAAAMTASNVHTAECFKNKQPGQIQRDVLIDSVKRFKEITPAEREHYNHLANEQNAVRQAEYEAWIKSHTPAQIRAANNARTQLRKMLKDVTKRRPAHTAPLKDDRRVKRPISQYAYFAMERWASGDMKGIAVGDAGKVIGAEWKALSAGEKKKYADAAAADLKRYHDEVAATY
ncbi:hypothetical protein DE146DRAFT_31341 [Phaeosphaeria sp. MPI-PUGE-AT-0046c]|nr:hypothetical protein DE146DRAFT_31341 [Phaeosphaeria sp. MPI-PUGE-AT-0046c]